MAKNSMVLYYDIRAPLEALTDAERGKLFLALLDYAENGVEPHFRGGLHIAFSFIRSSIDRDAKKWAETVERRREAGRKSAQLRAEQSAGVDTCSREGAEAAVPVPGSVPVPGTVTEPVSVPVPAPVSVGRRGRYDSQEIISSAADAAELERMKKLRERMRREIDSSSP